MEKLTAFELQVCGAAYVLERVSPATPFGKELLKNLKPYRRAEQAALAEELDNIEAFFRCFDTETALCNHLRALFSAFRDIRGSVSRIGGAGALSEVDLFELKAFLISLNDCISAYSLLAASKEINSIRLTGMEVALDILDPEQDRLKSFHISELYSPRLGEIRKNKREIEAKISIEMNNGNSIERLAALHAERSKAVAAEEAEELSVRTLLTHRLSPFKATFKLNISMLGELDFILSKAIIAHELGAVKPTITENTIELTDAVSPEVNAALSSRGTTMTPISIHLRPGTTILTGANMGGKSVAQKTVMLNAYLFQCGFFVFAAKARIPLFDYAHLVSGDMQSIRTGLSSFGAEIVKINEIITQAKKGFSLIILDEPAHGTNPGEGRAIAASLAAYLNSMGSISVIATHYDNVASTDYVCYITAGLKKDYPQNAPPESLNHLMDYRLIKASPNQPPPQDALTICSLLGLDDALINLIKKNLGAPPQTPQGGHSPP